MNKAIFQTRDAVTLIGAGRVQAQSLQAAVALAPRIVAADGGADLALDHGLSPEAVIGDFDSLSGRVRQAVPSRHLHQISEQDSTDFDKALRSIDAPVIIAVGFDGDRMDHVLASFNVLVRRAHTRCVMALESQVAFLCPPNLTLPLEAGTLVSLFPMAATQGRSEGLEWPIDGLDFAPDGRVGTSNRALGAIRLEMQAPSMLVILPLAALGTAVQALGSADGWPAL